MNAIFNGQFSTDKQESRSENSISDKLREVHRPFNESILRFYEITNGNEYWDTKEMLIRIWRIEDIKEFNEHCGSKNWAFADQSIFVGWFYFKIENEDVKVYSCFEKEELIASSLNDLIKILEIAPEKMIEFNK